MDFFFLFFFSGFTFVLNLFLYSKMWNNDLMEVVKHNIQSKCSLNLKQFVTCHLAHSIRVHAVGIFTDWRFRGLHRELFNPCTLEPVSATWLIKKEPEINLVKNILDWFINWSIFKVFTVRKKNNAFKNYSLGLWRFK